MKPIRKFAKELAGKSGPHSIKVKVIEKTNVHSSLENSTLDYQILTFQDEEGTKLRTVLFNDSLAEFEDTIEDQMEYEISNARVEMKTDFATEDPDDQLYRLHFNINTMVDRICSTKPPALPKYVLIAAIPKTVSLADRYDVLGIAIYVDPNCQITRPNGETREICEVIIVDQSSEQIMIITAWEEHAIEACRSILSIAPPFPVVGFTALRSAHRKGFSLAITPKTSITLEPTGEEATALRTWGEANQEVLADKSERVFRVRHPQGQRNIITVAQLLQKKAKDTLQEEHHWLRVQLSECNLPKLQLYHGCSNCGTSIDEDIGVTYTCHACVTDNVISCPRMSITFMAEDETGSYLFSALTENTEKMLEVSAADLHSMLPQEKEDYLVQIVRHLRSNAVYIQVAPAPSLSQKQVLVWVLQQVSLT